MQAVREPAVAGTFYSGNAGELARSVDRMLETAKGESTTPASHPKAIIAPHAGHVFSGPIAASVYARLGPAADTIRRVVLLGPAHRVGFRGIAATSANAYRTPLGDVAIDAEAVNRILGLPNVGFLNEAHAREHSLEVHLPFLQRTLDCFTLVPLVVGDARPEDVARVLDTLWGGDETLIVISSDLSHYHGYDEARQIDAKTCARIVALDESLNGEDACGCRPINGLLHLAREKGLNVEQVDVRNSGDTHGPRDRVVGYGAFTVSEPAPAREDRLPLSYRQRLLHVARDAIGAALDGKRDFTLDVARFPAALREQRASFVTINLRGRLRGCIGSLEAHRSLVLDVASNARAAAFTDPRFQPLTRDEFDEIELHVSVLSEPRPLNVASREELVAALRPGVDGLIIAESGKRATYLPSVWAQLGEPETFVSELRRKAGLDPAGWSTQTRVWRYHTEEFS